MATTFKIELGGARKGAVSPMTIVYYDEEFSTTQKDADFLEDYMQLAYSMEQKGVINAIKLFKILWACEKTYKQGTMENFHAWVKMLPNASLSNRNDYEELAGAIQSEFFPDSKSQESTQEIKED